MIPDSTGTGRDLASAASALQAILALLVTMAAIAFAALAPSLGGFTLGGSDEGGLPGPLQGRGLGFSPVDAVGAILGGLTILLWLWVVLDVVLVSRPLARGDLLSAEAPALLLGILQTVLGGVIPGLLLLAASRQMRRAIRVQPHLERQRALPPPPPAEGRTDRHRLVGVAARVGLGLLWGIAGVAMFQNRFYQYLPTLIETASKGAPVVFGGWFHFWIFLSSTGSQPAAYLAGSVQLLLAFGLIAGFARKIAYFAGLFAAVFLWMVPEAFGGPFVLGAFSLGPGVVYAVGAVALIAIDATFGRDPYTLDSVVERRFPMWARIAEVRVGLLPPIGRWYARNSARLGRASEVGLGAVLAGSAAIAWTTHLGPQIGTLLTSRSADGFAPLSSWYGLCADLFSGHGPELALVLISLELLVAAGLLSGVARTATYFGGLALVLFVWTVVEGLGGTPGPGYTDPGVGIAEAFVLLALVQLHRARGLGPSVLDAARDGRVLRPTPVARIEAARSPRG